jgi:hypothetical protein
VSIMDHRPLRRCILDLRGCSWVFHSIYHCVEEMGPNGDIAGPDSSHGFFRGVVLLDLLAFRLLRFRVVSHQYSFAKPFLLRSFQGNEEDGAVGYELTLVFVGLI